MTAKRQIAFVTGTRAEYGLLVPIFRAMQNSSILEPVFIVTGMHLSSAHGHTIDLIRDDGFPIMATVDMLIAGDTVGAMSRSIGLGIIGMTQLLEQQRPYLIILLGDRGDAFATAIVAAHLGIPIAHLHGGEITGSIDETVRHSITQLAHLHLPATEQSAKRIYSMGQAAWRVYVVGAPGLDTILNTPLPQPLTLAEKYGINLDQPLVLAVQHPDTMGTHNYQTEMIETLEALIAIDQQTVLIYPNADAGAGELIDVIKQYENHAFLRTFASLPHHDYLSFLRMADVLVGNSSSGIIEAPSFFTPVVNIGDRQRGRERASNVIEVGYDRTQIRQAIQTALYDESFRQQVQNTVNPYGDGQTGPRVAKIIEELSFDEQLLNKQWEYEL